jgi:hypothetical protein
MAKSMKADLAPGQTLSIRLNGPVYSEHSRTGDPVEGTVTYPLCKGGENITCPAGQLVVPPGTKVQATVLFAQKASSKYARPRLVLDFSNIVHADGARSPLYAHVIDVDNARETVRNNEILGIQPHASTKASIVLMGVGMTNPKTSTSPKPEPTRNGDIASTRTSTASANGLKPTSSTPAPPPLTRWSTAPTSPRQPRTPPATSSPPTASCRAGVRHHQAEHH